MENLSDLCAEGTSTQTQMIPVNDQVSLRVFSFFPAAKNNNPVIFFIAGWISRIQGWQAVLLEMTKDFTVHYVETREKISSKVNGRVEYGAEDIGEDILGILTKFNARENNYILLGSSLGATSILDCYHKLDKKPLCLVLIGPNAVFQIAKWSLAIIHIFPPRLYLVLKPVIKFYLRKCRLDIKNDFAQYRKYCSAIDAANPWKLKKSALKLSKYKIWERLPSIDAPTMIVGGTKDILHIPENLAKMTSMIKNATYLDLETNANTHSKEVVEEIRKYISQL